MKGNLCKKFIQKLLQGFRIRLSSEFEKYNYYIRSDIKASTELDIYIFGAVQNWDIYVGKLFVTTGMRSFVITDTRGKAVCLVRNQTHHGAKISFSIQSQLFTLLPTVK